MSTDWRTEIYGVNLDMRRFTRGVQGSLSLERFDQATQTFSQVAVIKSKWCCDYVINQTSGVPEAQIEIADQGSLSTLLQGNSIQAVVVEGVRYERREQDLLNGVPKVWRLRCQPIGAQAEAALEARVERAMARLYTN